MKTIGIICEYNPFHKGHAAQIAKIRAVYGPDCAVVCLMSGNYVQRGEPAIFSKSVRAKAAVVGGADLVLELPLTAALSSAEGFAEGGVGILDAVGCKALSFGAECGDRETILNTARLLLRPELDERIRHHLKSGCSYPAARESALRDLGGGAAVSRPNDILAVEYCKAILRRNSAMEIQVIPRPGDYHAETIDPENPSATALRSAFRAAFPPHASLCEERAQNDFVNPPCLPCDASAVEQGFPLQALCAVPDSLHDLYRSAPLHTMAAGERAMLARLRTLPDSSFEALPFGSEGLWSKLMKNCRSCASVEEILNASKSKRYTLTRVRRMLLCAFLGLTALDLAQTPPYVRILAFNDRGREVLQLWKKLFPLINAGRTPEDAAYYRLESRASDLYSLFSERGPRPAGEEERLRVEYLRA